MIILYIHMQMCNVLYNSDSLNTRMKQNFKKLCFVHHVYNRNFKLFYRWLCVFSNIFSYAVRILLPFRVKKKYYWSVISSGIRTQTVRRRLGLGQLNAMKSRVLAFYSFPMVVKGQRWMISCQPPVPQSADFSVNFGILSNKFNSTSMSGKMLVKIAMETFYI